MCGLCRMFPQAGGHGESDGALFVPIANNLQPTDPEADLVAVPKADLGGDPDLPAMLAENVPAGPPLDLSGGADALAADVALDANAATLIYDRDDGFWSAPAGPGTPAVITFSFLEAPTSQVPAADFSAFGEALRQAARSALAAWAAVAGLTFIEVPAAVGGEIRFGFDASMDGNTVGYAYMPNLTEDGESTVGGDVYLLTSRYASSSGAPGTQVFEVLLHEIGHALGLKHPFDEAPVLAGGLDNTNNTVMSYTHVSGPKSAPQSIDIAAVAWLYGTAAEAASDGVSYSHSQATNVLTTTGSAGRDEAVGVNLNDAMLGNDGDDALWGVRGNDTLDGSNGNDSLDGGFGNDLLSGGAGTDQLDGGASGSDTLDGGAGDDVYLVTRSGLTILDASGTDTARASLSYTLPAAIENLVLTGSAYRGTGNESANWVDGSNNANQLQGMSGNDFLRGFDGADAVYGGAGADTANGNIGNDTVFGDDGADVALGGQGSDIVHGGIGDDPHVNGNRGNDTIYGGDGADTMFGGQDQDVLYGDAGNDRLAGDRGNDTLFGGAGADRFELRTGGGADQVQDFSFDAGDRIQVAAGIGVTLAGGSGGQAEFRLADGSSLILAGIQASAASLAWVVSA